MTKVKVDIVDSKGKAVATYHVAKLTVRANTRLMKMIESINKLECSDAEQGQLMSCAALACTLVNTKGELIYPPVNQPDNAYDEVCDTLDGEHYNFICEAYNELNPIKSTLEAKKKKY